MQKAGMVVEDPDSLDQDREAVPLERILEILEEILDTHIPSRMESRRFHTRIRTLSRKRWKYRENRSLKQRR